LASHAGEARGFEIRREFRQISLVIREADESSKRVPLAGVAADALDVHSPQLAARHVNGFGALAHVFEIDI
jgi:hypothetical protein